MEGRVTALPFAAAAAESKDTFAWSVPASRHPRRPSAGAVHCSDTIR